MEKATYDVEKGEILVYLPKLEQGKFFEGLDMVTTLMGRLAPTNKPAPLIETLGETRKEDRIDDGS